jgi:hypothetical protein
MGRVAACHGSREIAMFAARRQGFLTPHCKGRGKMRAGGRRGGAPTSVTELNYDETALPPSLEADSDVRRGL